MLIDQSILKISSAYWATAPMQCWRCKQVTSVTALIALPPTIETEDDEEGVIDEPLILEYSHVWPSVLLDQLRTINPHIYPDYSEMAEHEYLMNHCSHCAAKIGDFYVMQSDGPFLAYDEAQFQSISMIKSTLQSFELQDASFAFGDGLELALDTCFPDWRHIRGTV